MDISTLGSVYFVGIGGVSMSSLALFLKSRHIEVAGYDSKKSAITDMLADNSVKVYFSHSEDNLASFTTVVYSAAISHDDPEMVYARKQNKNIISRASLLGMISLMYPHSIGVSGTHGKSTTTGMLTEILLRHDAECSVLAGAKIPAINSLYKIGRSENLVFEACEYKNSFLEMFPSIKVVLNVEHDHVDFFPTLEDVKKSFYTYIDTPRPCGGENTAIVNLDCKNAYEASVGTRAGCIYYSVNKKCDVYAENIETRDSYPVFDIVYGENRVHKIKLKVCGIHNIQNALAAFAAALAAGVEPEIIKAGLESFTGVNRRFEHRGTLSGACLIDDYAHHPDEIRATLSAAREMCKGRIICAFQPHTYSRTLSLMDQFAKELSRADIVLLADIYPAREENIYNISSKDLARRMENALYLATFENIASFIAENAKANDMVITMGAGDIDKVHSFLPKDNNTI